MEERERNSKVVNSHVTRDDVCDSFELGKCCVGWKMLQLVAKFKIGILIKQLGAQAVRTICTISARQSTTATLSDASKLMMQLQSNQILAYLSDLGSN